ncbi:hypothetical protein V8C86DRAFT_3087994 [Haematococcus lacustris]
MGLAALLQRCTLDAARRPTASTLVVELARLEDSARAESRRETAALKGRRAATTHS